MNCEGGCKAHHGKVVRVNVYYKPHDVNWGRFYYCQTAIENDIAEGFTVTEVVESPPHTPATDGSPPGDTP